MPEDLRKTVFFALAGENPLPGGSGLALPRVTFASAAPPRASQTDEKDMFTSVRL